MKKVARNVIHADIQRAKAKIQNAKCKPYLPAGRQDYSSKVKIIKYIRLYRESR